MSAEDPGRVRYERMGTTATITFDRPAARNAMTWAMYEQLGAALDEVAAAPDLRTVVLRGEGTHFVAGTDISQFSAFSSGDDGVAYEKLLDAIVERLETVKIPTLAVIQGYCVGGGLALAAACDLRICTPDARFGVPIAKTVGNCLSMANLARLVSHLGESATKAMLYTATFLSAEDARARAFVIEVAPAGMLTTRVEQLCTLLAGHAPITLQVTKEGIRRVVSAGGADGADLVRRAYGSRDFREGVAAFVAKRPPHWEGR